ncbi:MAG: 2-amino-4-hydroxy-6-hydroxymethyldihydropteridine diphosphokinase [Rhodospirillales bacterium]|nr:2-amino-4-hydroxy-6-hydroxymethyldihydropteridine diphosphokinase [Rhodospirillales bacterium]
MILIGIGSNLPGPHGESPRVMALAAVVALGGIAGLRLAAVSRFWETAPVLPAGQPAIDQPRYVNAVARLEHVAASRETDPAWLLARLQAIEAAAGRRRGARNAARPLDLDILDIDGRVRPAPDPVLPHPRLAGRAFVLRPLAEVAPGWRHPLTGQTIATLLAGVTAQDAAPL